MTDSEPTALRRPGGRRGFLRLMEQHRLGRAVAIGLLAASAALLLRWAGALDRAELAAHDWAARRTAPGGRSDLVEIVDFDEPSVQCYEEVFGPWGQWPRDVHADLVKAIAAGHPKVIAVDLLFAGGGESGADRDLAEACRTAGNVVLACSLNPAPSGQPGATGRPELPAADAERLSLGAAPPGQAMQGATWPFPGLLAACRAVGSIQLEADQDATARSVSPAVAYGGRLWPSMSTAAASAYLGARPALGNGRLSLGGVEFPLGPDGRRLLRWYGPGTGPEPLRRYRSTSAAWVLEGARRPEEWPARARMFEGRIVLIGCSAAGGFDFRRTPMGLEPGHFIHAAAIENLVRGDSLRRAGPGWSALAALGAALAGALAFAAGSARRAALIGSGASLLLAGACAGTGLLLFGRFGLWIDLAAPLAALGLALAGSLLAGYLVEGRQARVMRRGMARFLSPEVLHDIAGDLEDLRPGMGRKREITVMFCDARGFTGLSERLAPEAAVEVLDAYLGAMSDCILAHGGTLSKYIGDGIMAFWNAPADCPDHPARAARAALAMIRAQEGIKERLRAAGRPAFDIGVGLHVGEAIVGTVGSEQRLDYTAIGDTVNLASRVEGLTKDFRVRICVTGDFAGRAGHGRFEFRELGRVQVKGRSAGVEILELAAERPAAGQEERK